MKRITSFLFLLQFLTVSVHAFGDNYGAIAYDLKTNGYGVTWDQPSQQAANQVAFNRCATVSGNCNVVLEFANNCGAYSTGRNETWGQGYGPTREVAERAATFYCNQNGTGCMVRVWGCNTRAGSFQPDTGSSTHVDPDAAARNRSRAEDSRWWGGQEQYDKICRESPGGC